MVYDDAEVLYAEVKKDGEALLEEAFSVLFPNSVPLTPSTRSKSMAGSSKIVAYNTTFFPRWDIVKIPLAKAGGALKSSVLQASDNGKEGYAIMHCANGGSVGELKHPSNALHAHLKPVSGAYFLAFYFFFEVLLTWLVRTVYTNGSSHFVLRNGSVQLTISNGRITSLVDVKLKYVFQHLFFFFTFKQFSFFKPRTHRRGPDGWFGYLPR